MRLLKRKSRKIARKIKNANRGNKKKEPKKMINQRPTIMTMMSQMRTIVMLLTTRENSQRRIKIITLQRQIMTTMIITGQKLREKTTRRPQKKKEPMHEDYLAKNIENLQRHATLKITPRKTQKNLLGSIKMMAFSNTGQMLIYISGAMIDLIQLYMIQK